MLATQPSRRQSVNDHLVCACSHTLANHERPTGVPYGTWGGCRATTQVDGVTQRCDCREAWPMEENDD